LVNSPTIRVGRLRDSQLVERKLTDLRMLVCASPTYLARRGVPQARRDLADHDCLVFSDAPGTAEWRFAGSAKADRRIRISGRLWMNSRGTLAAAAKRNVGMVHVPSWQVESDVRAGRLRRILADYKPPATPLHLVFQPSRLAPPKTRAFVDYLVERWGPSILSARKQPQHRSGIPVRFLVWIVRLVYQPPDRLGRSSI
jgi:DNA-binding transcriptional LysR family regulator